MIAYNTLGLCIDSDSINSVYHSRKETVDRLLLYHIDDNEISYYNFVRSPYDPSPNVVSKIPVVQYAKSEEDEQKVERIGINALKKPRLSDGEKNFLLSISNYSGLFQTLDVIETGHNIEDKLFVTENEDFLSKRYSLNRKVSLESFFPGIRLVNLLDCLEIMDLFAKTHGLYIRSPNARMDKWYWYWIYFRWKVPHYDVHLPKPSSFTTQDSIVQTLGKRICYLLIAVDELGKIRYLRSEDESMVSYHFNYLLSLISSVFDSLAIHTYEKYSISFPSDNVPSRISLKNNGGKKFLREVEKHNIDLRNHIRGFGNFINLIDNLRNRVIHTTGLKEMGFFVDSRMSSTFSIDSNEEGTIRSYGDKSGPYKILSEWGVYKYVLTDNNKNYFLVNPYYFARSASRLLLKYADEYLKLVCHNKFLNKLDMNDSYYQVMTEFERLSLRGTG